MARGDAEVGDDRLTLLEQDVLGLDVAVDHVEPVGVGQRAGHGSGDTERHVHRQRPLAGQPVAQALAARVRHDEVEQAVAFAGVVQRQDLGMGQAGGDPDLAEKPLRLVPAGRRVGPQHLDGHLPGVLHVLGQIDRGRAAPPDLLLDEVAVTQGSAQADRNLGHDRLGLGPREWWRYHWKGTARCRMHKATEARAVSASRIARRRRPSRWRRRRPSSPTAGGRGRARSAPK